MEKTTKVTKKEYFTTLINLVAGMEKVGDYAAEDVIAFLNTQVEQLDNKAAKAKAKAIEKKAETDELGKVVLSFLTEDLQTGEEIANAIVASDEKYADVTKNKVVSRLKFLIDTGVAVKDYIKNDAGKKVMGYGVIPAEIEE